MLDLLDSGLRRNDDREIFYPFYESRKGSSSENLFFNSQFWDTTLIAVNMVVEAGDEKRNRRKRLGNNIS